MTSGTAYEEFLKQKPNHASLGEYYFDLLRDATRSLILNTANEMKSVKAKKHLGQHFLMDLDIARRIADTVFTGVSSSIEYRL